MKNEIKKTVAERIAKEKQTLSNNQNSTDNLPDYFIDKGCLTRWKWDRDKNPKPITLCNFSPVVIEKIIEDDGREESLQKQTLILEATLFNGRRLPRVEVSVKDFSNLSWVAPWLPFANIEPGQTTKDHVRYYIQKNSIDCKETIYYAQTGWKKIKGKYFFLHGGGAVGKNENMEILIKHDSDISRYFLPSPPPSEKQEEAAEFSEKENRGMIVSLAFLEIGKREVTIPLFCAVWLAPLISLLDRPVNFSYFCAGVSRTFKTTVVLLVLSFFGNFDKQQKLANFTDSAASIEDKAFHAADVPFALDDWSPSTSKRTAEQKEQIVDTIIRSFANRNSRARMKSDMTKKESLPPRGLLLITSELLPTIESIITRIVTLEFTHETINREKLTQLQNEAEILPYAMQNYLLFVRDNMADIQNSFRERFPAIREKAITEGCAPRIAEHIAFQMFALETALTFFIHYQTVTNEFADELIKESWRVFLFLSERQENHVQDDNPVEAFIEVMVTLLIQDQARLEPHPNFSGERIGRGGEQIGWYDSEALYLLPAAVWGALHAYYKKANSHFVVSSKTAFFAMLRHKKIVQTGTDGKTTIMTSINGRKLRILKIIDPAIIDKCRGIS